MRSPLGARPGGRSGPTGTVIAIVVVVVLLLLAAALAIPSLLGGNAAADPTAPAEVVLARSGGWTG